MIITRSHGALLALLGLLACGGARRPPADRRDAATVRLARAPEFGPVPGPQACDLPVRIGTCPGSQCGSNSAYLTGADFDVLSLDGCRNHARVRLVPGALQPHGGACPQTPLYLDLAAGELRATATPGGAPVCRGAELIGATLWIEGPPSLRNLDADRFAALSDVAMVRQELRIAAVGTVASFPAGVDPPGAAGPSLPTYTLERTGVALALPAEPAATPAWRALPMVAPPRRPLCLAADAWEIPWTAPATAPPSADQQMLAVAGETYNEAASVDLEFAIGVPPASRGRWFHLACAGSALAKTRLLGYDPLADAPTAAERIATLKMLTATYCETSLTTTGVPIFTELRANPSRAAVGAAERQRIGPIEARWTEHGASCISHSRLWRVGVAVPGSETAFVAAIQQGCQIPACPPAATDTSPYWWTTYTVDHIPDVITRRLPGR